MIWLLIGALPGCRDSRDGGGLSGSDSSAPLDDGDDLPPPRDDLVPALGTDGTLDIATWNIENFPKRYTTPALVADLITSLRLDVIAVQEISDVAGFDELVARLPTHDAILSEHVYSSGNYQKLAVLYRTDLLMPSDARLLFAGDTYAFPRPPLEVHFTALDPEAGPDDFTVITVHLKAGGDSD
ncbi:MAG: endonuclease/exonuclease/phosphatase family protein, partial [Myxococcota bacterium]